MRAATWWMLGLAACAGGGDVVIDTADTAVVDDAACTGSFETIAANTPYPTAGGQLQVSWTALNPGRPAKGDNAWTLTVTDAQGAPVAGATVTVTPFMPAHGHGLTPAVYAGAETVDAIGAYVIDPFTLTMPGTWRFTIEIDTGVTVDALERSLCVQG